MIKLRHSILCIAIAMGISSAKAETIVVTNTNASGAGSLTQAILDANANPNLTTIEFNIPGTGDRIINGTDYPAFNAPVLVTTSGNQTGRTVLDAPIINGPGALTTGFTFNAAAHNSTVQFVTFKDFVLSISVNAGEVSIVNNQFENNIGGADIRLVYGPASFIKGNTFNGNGYAIAGVGASSLIIGNTFIKEGISMGTSGGVTIGGANSGDPNTFTNINGDAINLSMNGATVYGNTINGATGVAIAIQGIDNTVSKNKISGVTGYDITFKNGWFNRIINNDVTGNNGIFNGILVQNGDAYTITGNKVNGGAIELDTITSSNRGPLTISNNTITNDPTGYSAHGALTLIAVNGAVVSNNIIDHNAGNGIILISSSNNTILSNTITENGRVGVYAQNGNNNKITKNIIAYNHADAGGGRTGIFLNNANNNKLAPTISTAKRVGSNFVITGTGAAINDTIEVFLSDRASRNSNLTQNAYAFAYSFKATSANWTATFPATNNNSGEVYFIATSTATQNTSMFSKVIAVEINGPTATTTNHGSTYSVEYIPGASYSFWSTLPISSLTQNGNEATFDFNQPGTGSVSVGYTDPTTGQWKMYSLNVTVYGAAKKGDSEDATISATVEAYPNPFTATTTIKVDKTLGENVSLNLYNTNGILMYSSTGHTEGEEVELGNNLTPGVYTLQMIAGKEVKTIRIVKGN